MHFIYSDILRYFRRNYFKYLIIFTSAIWLVVYAWPKNNLEIIYCQVGQGDTTLIQQGFQQLLIDSGPGKGALDCLERHLPFFDKTIEMAIITHPQSDHAAGLIPILERYRLMSFVYNGIAGEGEFWGKLSEEIITKNIKTTVAAAGDKIKFVEAELTVLWPKKLRLETGNLKLDLEAGKLKVNDPTSISQIQNLLSSFQRPDSRILGVSSSHDTNFDAIVLKLNYDQFSALFTSDISEKEELSILPYFSVPDNSSNPSNLDILKVAHHGSKYSSSAKFLEAIRPALSIIEVGKNSYGHPTKEAIDRLTQIGSKILRTDRDGDVVVTTNGQKWNYKTQI